MSFLLGIQDRAIANDTIISENDTIELKRGEMGRIDLSSRQPATGAEPRYKMRTGPQDHFVFKKGDSHRLSLLREYKLEKSTLAQGTKVIG